MRLVIIDSAAKQTEVENLARLSGTFNANKTELWIGASDWAKEGTFVWHDTGAAVGFAKWLRGMPDNKHGMENCVHLWWEPAKKIKWEWNDVVCHSRRGFVCEKKARN